MKVEYPKSLKAMRFVGETNYRNAIIYRYTGESGWRVRMPWNVGSPEEHHAPYRTIAAAKRAVNDANS